MSLPNYPEYKTSGVEWLGDVPGHWEVKPIKAVSTCNDAVLEESTSPDYEIEYIEISGVNAIRGISETTVIPFGNAPSRARRRVTDGDVLVSTVRTYLRAIAPVTNPPTNMIASTGFAVIRPRHIEPSFLGFMFQAEFLIAEIIARSVGVSYPAINASDLMRLDMPIPTREEQQTIAAFLDLETGKIDALIAEQRRLVELLAEKRQAVISHAVTKGLGTRHSRAGGNPAIQTNPRSGQNRCPAPQEFSNQLDSRLRGNDGVVMKDSGIAWLGEVPEHWEVKRLKHISPFITVGVVVNPSTFVSDEGFPFIYGGDIREGVIDWVNSRRIDAESSEANSKTRLKAGDLLTVRVGAPGITAVVPLECDGGNCASVMLVRQGAFNSHWLCYAMNTRIVRFQVEVVQYGAAQEQFNISHAVNFWTPTPSRDEQDEIVAYLDSETAKFDTLTAEANRAIELLQERRSALISAAVTGKIDVREQQV